MDNVDLYFELLKKPVFSIEDVNQYYENIYSARSAVQRLLKGGLVIRIRNNMYTCINGENDDPVANRFQIASAITPTSYISHYSAMEYYGLANQVFYEVYVSSETFFRDFTFDGYSYHFIKSRGSEGVICPEFSGGIKITDMERTALDCIKDMDKISGIEEVIQDISAMRNLQEQKLITYLAMYQNQFLYQKTGYILRMFSSQLKLSENFFKLCKSKIGKSKRYITSDIQTGTFDNEWNLVIPERMASIMGEGFDDDEI